MLRSPSTERAMASFDGGTAYKLGAVQVYASATSGVPDSDFGSYLMQDDAMEIPCNWDAGFGGAGNMYSKDWPSAFGEMPLEPLPPPYPPEGMTQDEYDLLNEFEKRVIWRYPWLIPAFRSAYSEAFTWSANQTADGPHNGPQDALRHAYWMCRLTKTVGPSIAQELGNAHEMTSTAYSEVRMDLRNNFQGRLAGMNDERSCGESVYDRWVQGTLATAPIHGPNQHPLGGTPPTQPPSEAQ